MCRIRHRLAAAILVLPCVLRAEFVRPARTQQDARQQRSGILEFPNLGPVPGSTEPALGPGPGALEPAMTLGGSAGILGGSRRVGRTPRTTRATTATTVVASRGLREPEALPGPQPPPAAVPLPAPAFDERIFDDPGPPDGLTLDAAIERMMKANLDMRALRHELTQADADVLTAGLRTNPLVYMDTQFIPYGSFTPERPGGPTQYDLNVTYPLDVSGKRKARVVVARMARSAIESQFQDVARRQIDNVYKAFTTLQAAWIDLLMARAADREYRRSCTALDQIEQAILPRARNMLHRKTEQLAAGTIDSDAYQVHLDETAEIVQSHRDALLRRRTAMLDLNTAVGLRLLP